MPAGRCPYVQPQGTAGTALTRGLGTAVRWLLCGAGRGGRRGGGPAPPGPHSAQPRPGSCWGRGEGTLSGTPAKLRVPNLANHRLSVLPPPCIAGRPGDAAGGGCCPPGLACLLLAMQVSSADWASSSDPSGSPCTASHPLSSLPPAGAGSKPHAVLCHPPLPAPAWAPAWLSPGKIAILVPKGQSCALTVGQRQPTDHSQIWATLNTPPMPHLPAWLQGHYRSLCHRPGRVAPTSQPGAACWGLACCTQGSEPGSSGWPGAGHQTRSARPQTRPAGATPPLSA